ncbi:hypothetical protein Tco_0499358 [Tanacetum coccineum]
MIVRAIVGVCGDGVSDEVMEVAEREIKRLGDGEDGGGDEMMMTTVVGWQRGGSGGVVVRLGCDCSSGCGKRLRRRRWWIWWRGGIEVIRMVSAGG